MSVVILLMTRHARFLCFAFTAGLWAIPSLAQTRETEAAKVYSAAFDFLFGQYPGEFPQTIVVLDTTSADAGSIAYNGVLKQPHLSPLDPETIRDFEAQNRQPRAVTQDLFSYRLPIVLLTFPEYFRLDTLGRKMLKDDPYNGPQPGILMDAFVARYPGAWGITVVSRVGFNAARTEALVLVGHQCGVCYHSETLLFRKNAGKWVIEERIPFVSRDGLGPGQARFLGVNAQALPRLRMTQDSTRRAIADSLVRAKRPRRIHGVITNRQTGRPIPFAQVMLYQPKYAPNAPVNPIPRPDRRIVADERGRYTISNPAVGPTELVILCPGPVYSHGPSLGAPGVYVYPGTDTTFNFAAPDLSACWRSIKIHQLQPGWFESSEALGASVPELEEADVMRAVVRSLQEWQPDRPIVATFTRTIPRCRFDRLCGSIQLPRLLRERAIDSSTVADFRSKTARSSILNPGFASSLGLRVITDAELKYLSGEAVWPLGWPARDAQTDSTRFWKSFKQLYGERATIVRLSRAGLNADRTEALVEARVDTAYEQWTRQPARMIILRKTHDDWVVVNRSAGGGSLSGVMEGNACFASSVPRETVSRSEIQKLEGVFELTMVRVGDEEVTDRAFLKIGHRLPARWLRPPPGVTVPPPTLTQSFEMLDANGTAHDESTMATSLGGIPRNVVRDPRIVQLDGFYQNLTILSITDSGFSGSYVSGVFGDSNFGYFCARRVANTR